MPPKTPKSSKRFAWLALIGLWAAAVMAPTVAYAYVFNYSYSPLSNGVVCPPSGSNVGITERVVYCVKTSVLSAVHYHLGALSTYVAGAVAAAISLAITVWGAMMAMGKASAPTRDLAVLLVKIGCVLLFTANFGNLFGRILDALEYMLYLVTSFSSFSTLMSCHNSTVTVGQLSGWNAAPEYNMHVWQRVDCVLQTLVGGVFRITNAPASSTLLLGFTGFLAAALFSGTAGVFIAIMGFLLIAQLLMALARAVYIYLTSYIAFAVMVLISPFFLPLMLFRATKAYFEKWLKLSMGFLLQPIFLFAYLAMLAAAFDTVIYSGNRSIARAITGEHFDQVIRLPSGAYSNFSVGRSLVYSGAYAEGSFGSFGVNVDYRSLGNALNIKKLDTGVMGVIGEQVMQAGDWVNPSSPAPIYDALGNKKVFRVDMPTLGINWQQLACWSRGSNTCNPDTYTTVYLVNLFISFIMALITCYIFIALLDFLPFVGAGIAGESLSMPAFGTGRLAPPGSGALGAFKNKVMGSP